MGSVQLVEVWRSIGVSGCLPSVGYGDRNLTDKVERPLDQLKAFLRTRSRLEQLGHHGSDIDGLDMGRRSWTIWVRPSSAPSPWPSPCARPASCRRGRCAFQVRNIPHLLSDAPSLRFYRQYQAQQREPV